MKSELGKCLAGEWYDCHDAIFLEYKNKVCPLSVIMDAT